MKLTYVTHARIINIVAAFLFLAACTSDSVEIVKITDTGVTQAQIVQVKTFDQCESASVLKAEVQFSKVNQQENSQELVVNGGINGEAAIPLFVKAQLEGGLETHLKSINSEITGQQESAAIEIPAHTKQEYEITWREIRREGKISYTENDETKVATFSVRTGLELASTTVRDLRCPDKVASSLLSTPLPINTPALATDTATATQTLVPATITPTTTRTPTSTYTPRPVTNTPTKTPTRTRTPIPPTTMPTVTPTISPERILLNDTFDNKVYYRGINTNLWQCDGCETADISQNNNSIRFEIDGMAGIGIHTLSTWPTSQLGFVQAKLKISEYRGADNGDVYIAIATTIKSGWWQAFCYIEGKQNETQYGFLTCSVVKAGPPGKENYACFSNPVRVKFNEWHSAKIGLNPINFTLYFYVDDKQVGSCTPEDAEELKKQRFSIRLGSSSNTSNRHMVTGIDDVIIVRPE